MNVEDTMKYRVVTLMTAILACVLLLGACAGETYEPKKFFVFDMSIELNDGFSKQTSNSYDGKFVSKDLAVYVARDQFDDLGDEETVSKLTLSEYAEQIIKNNKLDCSATLDKGLTTFTYTKFIDNDKYAFYTVVYKSEDAFWRVQFAGLASTVEEQKDAIRDYAWSVDFS